MIERCQERNEEVGQCELRAGHDGKHLAGYLMWPAALAARPQEQASQPPEAQGVERGWLLERDRNGPEWLGINRVEAYVEWMWTKDSTKALRFARREDAENYAGFVEDCWTITEHQWG